MTDNTASLYYYFHYSSVKDISLDIYYDSTNMHLGQE